MSEEDNNWRGYIDKLLVTLFHMYLHSLNGELNYNRSFNEQNRFVSNLINEIAKVL
jgi:hypothetical protein